MITEIRHIIFSNDELKLLFQTVSLEGFDKSKKITRIEVKEGPPPMVALLSEGSGQVDVESYQLARMIVSYCREKRIPLPKDALKTLHAQGDQLCFSIMSSLS